MSPDQIRQEGITLSEIDVVVDTNIWLHANNPTVDTFAAALEFVRTLLRSSTVLCFDTGVSLTEACNRSRILSEYLAQIKGSGVGKKILEELLQSGRWTDVSGKVTNAQRKVIDQNVPDKRDRVFAKVATNSKSQSLISHDKKAFRTKCKAQLQQKCGVRVSTCSEVLAR